MSIRETILMPDYALVFLNYPPSSRFYTERDLECVYFSAKSAQPRLSAPPLQVDQTELHGQIVRCPLMPRGRTVSISVKPIGRIATNPSSNHRWDSLVYEALIDRDNTTIVFLKGLNLRPERLAEPSRFECVYGWDFKRPKMLLTSDVVSVAQEIVRCRTPLSFLIGLNMKKVKDSVKVSVRVKGRRIFPSVARPGLRLEPKRKAPKRHQICVCTMLRNQARFLKEWVMYHTRIGVKRWFVYDNNSDDDIGTVIESLQSNNYNITRHVWPWIKAQEAGFAHCALRARSVCKWVGFIDVDEFFHLKLDQSLKDVIRRHSGPNNVGEIRTPCYSFGPSGLKKLPRQGVMVGYTCRLAARERHKSIVSPDALNSTLINVVHHFHLKQGFVAVSVDRTVMVINHYKYQVWEVFKEKFYRRVATFVSDWKEEQNVGSKDRAPGLGTKAVEPPDWSNRFCEVRDSNLRNWVLNKFADRRTHLLPWQPEYELQKRQRRKRRRGRGYL
ncbi:hypothetical protein L6164_008998 [Bauhinia variegata]|nr:hypothetical protein L6164_008998 [Bauhinia variegata]